jgi:alpha-ketoglutarate-dependent taurine dioxygenase
MGQTIANRSTKAAVTVEPLTGALGAEVHGVDLRQPVSAHVLDEICNALDRHQVLVFRHQDGITPEQQVAVGRLFGYPGAAEPWRTFREPNHRGEGIVADQERNVSTPPFTDSWHTDDSFVARPPIVGTLTSPVIPRIGGDTAWVSLYCIYEALSEPMKQLCEQLQGEHTWELMRTTYVEPRGPEFVARMEHTFPPMLHPLVQAHPATGRKYIYLGGDRGGWMSRIVGLNAAEGEMLLHYLQRQLDKIDYQFRWRWSPGDFIIWDQRTTNHYGTADHWVHDPHRVVRSVWVYPDDVPAVAERKIQMVLR